jgi:hypothetical protein
MASGYLNGPPPKAETAEEALETAEQAPVETEEKAEAE